MLHRWLVINTPSSCHPITFRERHTTCYTRGWWSTHHLHLTLLPEEKDTHVTQVAGDLHTIFTSPYYLKRKTHSVLHRWLTIYTSSSPHLITCRERHTTCYTGGWWSTHHLHLTLLPVQKDIQHSTQMVGWSIHHLHLTLSPAEKDTVCYTGG